MQFAQPSPTHGVPGFTLFPMSLFAHLTMLVSDCGVGAGRFLSPQILTPFADIPVVRAL